MKSIIIAINFVYLLPLFAYGASQSTERGYNEILRPDQELRENYRVIYPLFQKRYAEKESKFLKKSKEAFKGDNALDPLPRLLTEQEFKTLKSGVEQRGLALRAFLSDFHSGERRYASAGLIPDDVVRRIVARNGDSPYQQITDANTISFFYGPDIIRDESGDWRVIEDNIGFIGGIGDMEIAQKLMLEAYPEILTHYDVRKASTFYDEVARQYHDRAQAKGGKAILYVVPSQSSDNEDKRISRLFEKRGIETITPKSSKRLKITSEGVFLKNHDKPNAPLEKVGFIILNGEHSWIEPSSHGSQIRSLLEGANGVLKNPKASNKLKVIISDLMADTDSVTLLPDLGKIKEVLKDKQFKGQHSYKSSKKSNQRNQGLIQAILEGQVDVSYSPGIDFIGDKEMYIYVEDFIRYYLGEEPIIKNITTGKFNRPNSSSLDEAKLNEVFADIHNYVIKKVDGRGGDSVWVGPKIEEKDLGNIKDLIRASPDMFIFQKYTPLSYARSSIIDLRVIADVSPTKITVTDSPWGRSVPRNGNGKVNISDEGKEMAVLVIKRKFNAYSCLHSLQ